MYVFTLLRAILKHLKTFLKHFLSLLHLSHLFSCCFGTTSTYSTDVPSYKIPRQITSYTQLTLAVFLFSFSTPPSELPFSLGLFSFLPFFRQWNSPEATETFVVIKEATAEATANTSTQVAALADEELSHLFGSYKINEGFTSAWAEAKHNLSPPPSLMPYLYYQVIFPQGAI